MKSSNCKPRVWKSKIWSFKERNKKLKKRAALASGEAEAKRIEAQGKADAVTIEAKLNLQQIKLSIFNSKFITNATNRSSRWNLTKH